MLKIVFEQEFSVNMNSRNLILKWTVYIWVTVSKYLWNPVNLSWQQLWNISKHKSLSNPNCSNAFSKIPDWGSLQVPLILPNLVTFPFLQQNFLPLLRWCFRFFFWMRFLRTFSTFWAFFTQDFILRASCSSSSYVNILLFWSSISILQVNQWQNISTVF